METRIVEVTSGRREWSKFLVGVMDTEWTRVVEISEERPVRPVLLRQLGWTYEHLWVLDLQTGEGGLFRHGGSAKADLDKKRIWVCPLFEPFLTWLYAREWFDPVRFVQSLPALLDLPDARFAFAGYRRAGPAIEISTRTLMAVLRNRVRWERIAAETDAEVMDEIRNCGPKMVAEMRALLERWRPEELNARTLELARSSPGATQFAQWDMEVWGAGSVRGSAEPLGEAVGAAAAEPGSGRGADGAV